jgi:hypothetical protein
MSDLLASPQSALTRDQGLSGVDGLGQGSEQIGHPRGEAGDAEDSLGALVLRDGVAGAMALGVAVGLALSGGRRHGS